MQLQSFLYNKGNIVIAKIKEVNSSFTKAVAITD